MIYIAISSVLFILFSISLYRRDIDNYFTGRLCFIILLALTVMRGEVGTDYHSYIMLWKSIVSGGSTWYKELGFIYTILLSDYLGFDAELYYTFLNVLTLFIILRAVKLLKLNISAFFLFYFLFLYLGYIFNIMRQGFAMSFFLLALSYMIADKKKKFICASVIAFLFHYISTLIVAIYFWCKIRIKTLGLVVLTIVLLKFTGAVSLLLKIIFIHLFPSKVEFYINSAENDMTILNIAQRLVLLTFLYAVYLLSGKDKVIEMLFKVYLLGFSLYFFLSDFSIISGRIYMFFCIAVPAIFARYCYVSYKKTNSFILGVILFMILFPSLWILAFTPEFDYVTK